MSYIQNGSNILDWFYPTTSPSIAANRAQTTNFRINNVDISNNYVNLGTNSKIPVSQLYSINYFSAGKSIGNLFELNLPIYSGTMNINYNIITPNYHDGFLIQFLTSNSIAFRYKVNCQFVMVGGGGGGGNSANSNAGGGGGAGEVITGNINGYISGNSINITIGSGGSAGNNGNQTTIQYLGNTITANGGGYGGNGKGNGGNTTGSSSGGSGSYSTDSTQPGSQNNRNPLSNISIFQSMISYGYTGAQGNDQNNDSGAGGGGGGAATSAVKVNNEDPGVGGSGYTITFGSYIVTIGGGGGGGGRGSNEGSSIGGAGGIGGGGNGGGRSTQQNGYPGTINTGGGGGGACNDGGVGGSGGSGTVWFYILPSGVSL